MRSPALASGYYNRPDLQAAFQDGWFRSSDLGYLDAGGYLHMLGRADDVAWIGEIMVSATGIQDTLCGLPSVRYAAVVGNHEAGSWIAAVLPWDGSSVDLAQCRNVIAAIYGAAPVTIIPVERIQLTPQGKAERSAIADLAR